MKKKTTKAKTKKTVVQKKRLTVKERIPVLRVITRPNDSNPKGDIFGGWLMSQIDIAGAIVAVGAARGPISTVAVKELQFMHPLLINDLVSVYAEVTRIGNSSVTVEIEAFAQHNIDITAPTNQIAKAIVVYVAVDGPGNKRPIPKGY